MMSPSSCWHFQSKGIIWSSLSFADSPVFNTKHFPISQARSPLILETLFSLCGEGSYTVCGFSLNVPRGSWQTSMWPTTFSFDQCCFMLEFCFPSIHIYYISKNSDEETFTHLTFTINKTTFQVFSSPFFKSVIWSKYWPNSQSSGTQY